MLAVQNNCCWVTSLAAHVIRTLFVLHPGSINAKVFSICLHVLRSNNGARVEVITDNLSANTPIRMSCTLPPAESWSICLDSCEVVQDNLVSRAVLKHSLTCGQVKIPSGAMANSRQQPTATRLIAFCLLRYLAVDWQKG